MGIGTFWGLCNMLTGVESFEEMLEMTKRGDNRNVDMLVGDIYGRDYGKVGLAAETIASRYNNLLSLVFYFVDTMLIYLSIIGRPQLRQASHDHEQKNARE